MYVTVYTLFAQCLDDFTPEGLADIEGFYPRFCAGIRQPNATLEGWAQMMREAYEHWHPIAANLIVSASLNMITSTIIEHKRLVNSGALSHGGRGWAYYLRNMDGLGDAFAVFTFPQKLYPDVSQYLEAVPDMAMYIVHANDIISYVGPLSSLPNLLFFFSGRGSLATFRLRRDGRGAHPYSPPDRSRISKMKHR